MPDLFFEQPILNSPYNYPARHWELDQTGQPTQNIIQSRPCRAKNPGSMVHAVRTEVRSPGWGDTLAAQWRKPWEMRGSWCRSPVAGGRAVPILRGLLPTVQYHLERKWKPFY